MAKEWTKFEADYKKLKPDYEANSSKASGAILLQMRQMVSMISEGLNLAEEEMLAARKAGIKGDKLADFMKHSGFAAAVKTHRKLAGDLGTLLTKFDAMAVDAGKAATSLTALAKAIAKDLKSRKDSSASKKDIEALHDTCEEQAKDLAVTVNYPKKIKGGWRQIVGTDKPLEDVLKGAPDLAETAMRERDVPQLFADRVLKSNSNKVMSAYKVIVAAAGLVADGKDPVAAAAALKEAQAAVVEMKPVVDKYLAAVKEFGDALNNSKDKAKIQKTIDTMEKAYKAGVVKFKAAATGMKKAG